VRFVTSTGRMLEVGQIEGDDRVRVELASEGWLAGFWGWYGLAVDSFGVIWAR
jgi:hypothetical protein